MSNRFNPYQAWFGLSTSTKPSYYELLGLRNFETEPPVIAEAAECRLQLLAPHKAGPNADSATKLEREVTGVMNVLLSSEKRKQYDEKLRRERGMVPRAPSPASTDDMLPPALAPAEAPSNMLPPGASPPMMPAADPQAGGYPGYGVPGMPQPAYGAMDPYGAPPGMPAAPAMPSAPAYGAPVQSYGAPPQPYGMPQQPYGMPPQPYGAPDPYGQAAQPYGAGQAAQPYGAPAYAAASMMPAAAPYGASYPQAPMTAGMPAGMPAAATAASPYGDPSAAGAPFTSSNASQRRRQTGVRKQKNSTVMIAIGLLGGGTAVLAIIMLVVAAGKKDQPPAKPPQHVAVVPPNKINSEDLIRMQSEAALRNGFAPPAPSANDTFGRPGTYKSASQAELMAESVIPNGPKDLPSMPDLVTMMAPKGVVPSVATPKPAGTAPTLEPPTATPSATAPTTPAPATAMPATTPAAPAIAGTDGPKAAMEASLPADPARARSVQTMLGQARKFLKSRDYAKAEEIILQTQVLSDAPELITTAQNHNHASELLRTFWISAKEGVKSLKEDEELTYDGKSVKVVKHDDFNLVVKGSDNKEVVLVIDKLVPGLAVLMAEKTLPKDDPTTKSALAAFYGLDQGGDRAKATTLLDEAKALGADVDGLRAVIEAGT